MKQNMQSQVSQSFRPEQLRRMRKARGENQTEFWQRFGVSQSRGSRFELGTEIPASVIMLLNLYLLGIVGDHDLRRAMITQHHRAITRRNKPRASGDSRSP